MGKRGIPWIRKLIYFPNDAVPPIQHVLPGGDEVVFTTEDGLPLAAWFIASDAAPASTVLILPGNGGNRASRAPLGTALATLGYAVLLMDYRGYGGNPGKPSEDGLAADARAARAWLMGQRGADPDRLVFFGESLGTGVAVRLATEAPPAALVLRSPFTSLGALARQHYRGVPRVVLPDRYPTIDRIGSITAPTLVVAGGRDEIVPLADSRRVFDAANEPKRLVVVPDADHNDLSLLTGRRMIDEVADFLDEHLPR